MKRGEAIAILKEILSLQALNPNWVSLAPVKSDLYELHIKPNANDTASLETIVRKNNLELRDANGILVIYRAFHAQMNSVVRTS